MKAQPAYDGRETSVDDYGDDGYWHFLCNSREDGTTDCATDNPHFIAYAISDMVVEAMPTSIELTEGLRQGMSLIGGVTLTWKSRGAEIMIEILNDGEIQCYLGNNERHMIWQVEDYSELWPAIQSHLPNYQKW